MCDESIVVLLKYPFSLFKSIITFGLIFEQLLHKCIQGYTPANFSNVIPPFLT